MIGRLSKRKEMAGVKEGKIRVGVIFGGRSGEHEVSLNSARSVIQALDREKYETVPIAIAKDGHWLVGDFGPLLAGHETTLTNMTASRAATLLPEPTNASLMALDSIAEGTGGEDSGPSGLSVIARLDVVFPVLHGPYGEDGTIQGLLELAGVPYVGAGVVGSAVGMDKAIFKQVMAANDIPVLPWVLCTRRQWLSEPERIIGLIEDSFPYPVFTKPANLGSSVGINKCRDRDELRAGLNDAARFDRRLVIEQGVDQSRELEVSVLGNEDPIASVVGEIRPRREFYDYVAKYMTAPGSEDESELIIPAELTAEQSGVIRSLAVRAYQAIDCAGLGRVDMLLDKQSGRVYLNEINTIPGFTTISMYPKLWEATGIGFSELLDRLIGLALDRYQEKSDLETAIDISALQSGWEKTE